MWLLGGRACGRGPWVGVGDDAGWTVMGVHAEGPEKCKGRGRVTPRAAPCGGVGAVGVTTCQERGITTSTVRPSQHTADPELELPARQKEV